MTPEEDQRLGALDMSEWTSATGTRVLAHLVPRGPEELNSPEFKAELQEVVDELRTSVLKIWPA